MRLGAALLLATIAGCAATPGPHPASESTLALFDRLMRARCEHAVRCAPSGDDGCGRMLEACIDRVRLRDLVARGERTIDPDAASACLAALAADPPCRGDWILDAHDLSPPPLWNPGAIACAGSIRDDGYRACSGEVCAPFDPCTTDAACAPRCARRSALGEPCSILDAPCRDGLACDTGTDTCVTLCDPWRCVRDGLGTQCRYNRCVTPLADGDACDPAVASLCAVGSICRSDTRRCARVLAIGRACDPSTDACATQLPCDRATHRCEAPTATPRGCESWEACPAGEHCAWAELGASCHPGVGPGACAWVDDGFTMEDDCADGELCSTGCFSLARPVCVPSAAVGEACPAGTLCEQGTRCVDGTCRRTVLPWEPCATESPCPPRYTCTDGACSTPFAHVGEPCEHGGDCIESDCVGGYCCR